MLPIDRREVFENLKLGLISLLTAFLTYVIYPPLVGTAKDFVDARVPAEFGFVSDAVPWVILGILFFVAVDFIAIASKSAKWGFFTGFLILVQILWLMFRG